MIDPDGAADRQMTFHAREQNRRAWNEMVRQNQRFTRPARDSDFSNPLRKIDELGWLGKTIRGKKLLCLAAGGGKHGPLCAAAGADVTVVDLSPAMLELDRQVAAERKLQVRTVETSMEDLSMFQVGEFDAVIHPVSTCYVPRIEPVYREVARVTRIGGIYFSQHKQPASLQAEMTPTPHGYQLVETYYRLGPLPPVAGGPIRERRTLEYLHRWEEIIGAMCRADFVIEDLVEPRHARIDAELGTLGHRSQYLPPYVRIKARRVGKRGQDSF
ncbi:MAG: class I SAM-dependent methyltransferase [Pirellulaceae bacterium]